MNWKALIAQDDAFVGVWWGQKKVYQASTGQMLLLAGPAPREHGYYEFVARRRARTCEVIRRAYNVALAPDETYKGYLIGDRFVPSEVEQGEPEALLGAAERVLFIEDGLGPFTHVEVGRMYDGGPLVFVNEDFPLGPEPDVMARFLEGNGLSGIAGVTPALHAAFHIEVMQRERAEAARRARAEERRKEEEARALEARRAALTEQIGDAAGRRALALVDYQAAAKAALAVGGARLLDCRKERRAGEWLVRFGLIGRRFACIADTQLHIIDAGICLVDHHTGRKDDKLLTLESLPPVITWANELDKLVVFRHA